LAEKSERLTLYTRALITPARARVLSTGRGGVCYNELDIMTIWRN